MIEETLTKEQNCLTNIKFPQYKNRTAFPKTGQGCFNMFTSAHCTWNIHTVLGYSLKVTLRWFPNTAAVSADVIQTINSSSWRRLTHFLCVKNRAKVMLLSEVCHLYHAGMMWPDLLDEWQNVPQFPYPAAVVITRNWDRTFLLFKPAWDSFFCRTQKKIFWEMPQCCFVR